MQHQGQDAAAFSLASVQLSETTDQARPLASLERLLGGTGIGRLQGAHVVVVGIGGVGSWAAEALARSGLGQITLVDFDHISPSNLNRQVHSLQATIGQSKVLAMQERLLAINPGLRVNPIDDFVTPDNWPAMVDIDNVDAVIDCCDQLSAKLAMARWALAAPKSQTRRLVCVGAAGGKRSAQTITSADLALVTHDPLLAKLRYQIRRTPNLSHPVAPKRMGIQCVFSHEPVARPGGSPSGGGAPLNCAGYGAMVTVTATFGLVAAGLVINAIAQAD